MLKKKPKPLKASLKEGFKAPRTKIKVIGVGGGGCSIVSEIAKSDKLKNIDFIAVNTDEQALRKTPKECRILKIGQALTGGLGCGMNVEMGEKAAKEARDKIKGILEGADFCILVSSLGGGTGSGASPVIAETARALKKSILGIFTLPFDFEGEKKKTIARNSLRKMRMNLSAFSTIPNDRIFQIAEKSVPLKEALSIINRRMAFNLEGLMDMIYRAGLINIDWADFKTVLDGRGRDCFLNRAVSSGEERASKAAKEAVKNALQDQEFQKADRILFNIEAGKDLKMSEVDQISSLIFNFNKKAKIIFGVSMPGEEENKIGITIMATRSPESSSPKKEKKVLENKKPIKKKKASKPKKDDSAGPEEAEGRVAKTKRKNALAVKKEEEKEEKEILAEEKKWEFPSFLRKKEL
jgi:cell division protein FtsZ